MRHERYSGIDAEKVADVHAVSDPIASIRAGYLLFRKAAVTAIEGHYKTPGRQKGYEWHSNGALKEALYTEACRLVKASELKELEGREAVSVLREYSKRLDMSGLFLSAALNETAIDTLPVADFPKLASIGYRLKEGKTVITAEGTEALFAGEKSGGTVLNFGFAQDLCADCVDGFIGNFGRSQSMGYAAKKAFACNWGGCNGLGTMSEKTANVNFGAAGSLGFLSRMGVNINCGKLKEFDIVCVDLGGILINSEEGTVENFYFGSIKNPIIVDLGNIKGDKMSHNILRLDLRNYREECGRLKKGLERLKEIDTSMPHPEIIERIRGLDLAAARKEIEDAAAELAEYVRRKHG